MEATHISNGISSFCRVVGVYLFFEEKGWYNFCLEMF